MLNRIRGVDPITLLLGLAIAAMVGVQIAQRWWLPGGFGFSILHLFLAAVIVALHFSSEASTKVRYLVGLPLLLITIVWFGYYYPLSDLELGERHGIATLADMIIGGVLLIPLFILSWRTFGPLFPIIGLVAFGYGFLSRYVPGYFQGPPIPAERVMSRYVLQSTFSGLVQLFASYVWLILFWGMLLEVAGARKLIVKLAQALATRSAAGPGLMPVLVSGVVGSFSGSGASDVAITGPITIPMMKRAGYTGERAAAIEATASTAAIVTPPILGAVAFIMADRLGVAYRDILAMSIIPAILWYSAIIAYVYAASHRWQTRALHDSQEVTGGVAIGAIDTLRAAATIAIPLCTLLILVLMDFELYTAIFWAFWALVASVLIFRSETNPSTWWSGIRRAATFASGVTVTLAIVNILADTIFFTGLGSRIGDIVYDMSGGSLLWATFLMLALGIFLSAGMPSLVIYFVMVFTFQPVLLRFDVPIEVTHYTAFFMGGLSQIVMPVAASVLVAAGIAGVRYWPAGIETTKMIIPIVIMPFVFVFAPQVLIGVGDDTTGHVILLLTAIAASNMMISFGLAGWMARVLKGPERIGLLAIGAVVYAGVYTHQDLLLWIGMIVALTIFAAFMVMVATTMRRNSGSSPPAEMAATPREGTITPPG